MRTTGWLLILLVAAAQNAAAQDYPAKPVRLLVPYPAGGPVDAIARIIVPHLALGQNVIVENRAGAGGSLGAEVVAKSAPDGYMMLIGNAGPMTVNPVLRQDLGYDPRKDFAPVTWLTSAQMVLVVHPSLPVRTLKDFVALARAHPGALHYGSAGVGNLTHLGMELFQSVAQVKLNHVPYKGVAPAYVDLMSGEIAVMFGNVSGPLAHIQSGRLRALAVTSAKPSPVLPQVPRVSDVYPGFDLVTWMWHLLPCRRSGGDTRQTARRIRQSPPGSERAGQGRRARQRDHLRQRQGTGGHGRPGAQALREDHQVRRYPAPMSVHDSQAGPTYNIGMAQLKSKWRNKR
jgi:tripartite-type tricarboxylate transporter receptor subunit TctC